MASDCTAATVVTIQYKMPRHSKEIGRACGVSGCNAGDVHASQHILPDAVWISCRAIHCGQRWTFAWRAADLNVFGVMQIRVGHPPALSNRAGAAIRRAIFGYEIAPGAGRLQQRSVPPNKTPPFTGLYAALLKYSVAVALPFHSETTAD
jgi:hypothetical protein